MSRLAWEDDDTLEYHGGKVSVEDAKRAARFFNALSSSTTLEQKALQHGEGPGHPFRGNQYEPGESGGGVPATTSGQAIKVAKSMMNIAKQKEPKLTSVMKDVAGKHGGELKGLEFKLKEEKSLAEQIARRSLTGKTDIPGLVEAAFNKTDMVRYTIAYDKMQFTDKVESTIGDMKKAGFKPIKQEVYWLPGSSYRGINMAFEDDTGYKFEVQFHTPESFDTKMQTHKLQEKLRTSKNPAEKYAIYMDMAKMSSQVPTPPGIERLGIVKKFRQGYI